MKLTKDELKALKRGVRKAAALAVAGCLVLGTVPALAFDSDDARSLVDTAVVPTTAAEDDGSYVTGASPRPPAPGLEILGITDVECDPTNNTYMGKLTWSSPKFYIFGTYYYNTNPNPYYVNAVINWYENGDGWENSSSSNIVASPNPIVGGNSKVRTLRSTGGNPDAAIPTYGTNDQADSLWDLQPDVVVGTDGDTADYNGDTYQAAFEAGGITGYSPKTVRYQYSTVNQIIDSMYRIAAAADEVVAESNGTKKLRYDETATEIAINYEKYSRSLQGYILYRLALEGEDMKTVAVVSAYDSEAGTYTLLNNATGASNRYYECICNVTIDLADTLGSTTVTRDQLAACDAIVLSSSLTGTNATDVLATFTAEMQAVTYYNTGGTGTGVIYDSSRNSIDTTVEMGRILGAIYDEYISQDDLVCYWYDEFYHINTDKLGELIDNCMDGIRNWDADNSDLTSWTEADAEGYVKADVQAKLDLGTAYINSLDADDLDDDIEFCISSDTGEQYMPTDTTVSIEDATAVLDLSLYPYSGKACEPTALVVYAGQQLEAGVDYVIEYTNNVKVGTATATIQGIGLFSGTIVKEFLISSVAKTAQTIKAAKASVKVKKGKKVKVAISGAKTTLVLSYNKKALKVTVKSGKLVIKGKKKGTFKVKVYAKSTSKYKKSNKCTIKVKVK